MDNAIDVLCLGESLVDFLPEAGAGQKVRDVERWVRCTGGSPANVAVGVARLGGRSAMLGVVGKDEFGEYLRDALAAEGVDVSRLRQTNEGKTGLVFISLTERGDRSFAFFRTRSAELFLSEADVDLDFIARAKAIHCGTNSLLFADAQRAMSRMLRGAAVAGKIVSCDPNLRLHMWPDPADLRRVLEGLFPFCTVVKLAEDEIEFVTGSVDPERALEVLASHRVALPVVTLGEKGAVFRWKDEVVRVAAPKARQVVDTTGAGDGFVAALLTALTARFADRVELGNASAEALRPLFERACVAGARVVEHLGAVTGLPVANELPPEGG